MQILILALTTYSLVYASSVHEPPPCATTPAYNYPLPEIKLSITPVIAERKSEQSSSSTYTESRKLKYSSAAKTEFNIRPDIDNVHKSGGVIYADKSPSSDYATVGRPSGIESQKFIIPTITDKSSVPIVIPKPDRSYLPSYKLFTDSGSSYASSAEANKASLQITSAILPQTFTTERSYASPLPLKTFVSSTHAPSIHVEQNKYLASDIFAHRQNAQAFQSTLYSSPAVAKPKPFYTAPAYVAPAVAGYNQQAFTKIGISSGPRITFGQKYTPTIAAHQAISNQFVSKPQHIFTNPPINIQPVQKYEALSSASYFSTPIVAKEYTPEFGISHGAAHQHIVQPAYKPAAALNVFPQTASHGSTLEAGYGLAQSQQYFAKPLPAKIEATPTAYYVSPRPAPLHLAKVTEPLGGTYSTSYASSRTSQSLTDTSKLAGNAYSSAGGAVSHQYVSKPQHNVVVTPAIADTLHKVDTVSGAHSGSAHLLTSAKSLQYTTRPLHAATYIAPAAYGAAPTLTTPIVTAYEESRDHSHKYGLSGEISLHDSSRPLQSVTIAPLISYTGKSHSNSDIHLKEGAVSHQYVSQPREYGPPTLTLKVPTTISYASTPIKATVPTLLQSDHNKSYLSSGAVFSEYVAKPLQPAHGAATAGHATAGAVSHQYVSQPLKTVVRTSPVHLADYSLNPIQQKIVAAPGPINTEPAAITHQFISSPRQSTGHTTLGGLHKELHYESQGTITPVVTKSHNYAAGAVSHQYVSKPLHQTIEETPTISKQAFEHHTGGYVAAVAAPTLQYGHRTNTANHLKTGIEYQQHIHKPLLQPIGVAVSQATYASAAAGYEAPAPAKFSSAGAVFHQVDKLASPVLTAAYQPHAATTVQIASTGHAAGYAHQGAVSHQHVSKPLPATTILQKGEYLRVPAVAVPAAKIAAVVPHVTVAHQQYGPIVVNPDLGAGAHQFESGISKYASTGAVSHQHVSQPLAYAHEKSALAGAGIYAQTSSIGTTKYLSSHSAAPHALSGAVSHQHVSKPLTYAHEKSALAGAGIYAQTSSLGTTKYLSSHSGGTHALTGAVSHQHVSKPLTYAHEKLAFNGAASHVAAYPTASFIAAKPALAIQQEHVGIAKYASIGAAPHAHVSQLLPSAHYASHSTGPSTYASYGAPGIKVSKVSVPLVGAQHSGIESAKYVTSSSHIGGATLVGGHHADELQQSHLNLGKYSTSGAISHQHVSKSHQSVAHIATSSGGADHYGAYETPKVSIPISDGHHSGHFGSQQSHLNVGQYETSGAISHQHVSKPLYSEHATASGAGLHAAYGTPLLKLATPAISLVGNHHQSVLKAGESNSLPASSSSASFHLHGAATYASHAGVYGSGPLIAKPALISTPISGHVATGALHQQHITKLAGPALPGIELDGHHLANYGTPVIQGHQIVQGIPKSDLKFGDAQHTTISATSHQYVHNAPSHQYSGGHGITAPSGGTHLDTITTGNLRPLGHKHYGALLVGGAPLSHKGPFVTAHGGSHLVGGTHLLSGGTADNLNLLHNSGDFAHQDDHAGFNRYAPRLPSLTSHKISPMDYLKKTYTPLKTVFKEVSENYLEHYDHHPRYAFEYSVNDQHTGDIKHQREERDGEVVKGEYSLVEPDGNVRTVKYYADWETGFHAEIVNSRDAVVGKTLNKRNAKSQ